MPKPTVHDLSTIAPHLREQVLRRVTAIETFLADPGRDHADRLARHLSINTTMFYRLVSAWRAKPDPAALPGSGVRRPRSASMTPEQLAVIEHAEAACADRSIADVVGMALKMARAKAMEMPSRSAIRYQAERMRPARSAPKDVTGGADLLLTHCRIDVPVASNHPTVVAPVAAILIAAGHTDAVPLGIALHCTDPTPGLGARAILNALSASAPTLCAAPGGRKSLLVAAPPHHSQATLAMALGAELFDVKLVERDQTSTLAATSLLGRSYGRLRLKPSISLQGGAKGAATLPAGADPLSLDEAEEFVRARFLLLPGEECSPRASAHAPDERSLERLRDLAATD